MTKYTELKLKNTAGHKQFFPPLNRTIHAGGVINILVMCDGNGALADIVIAPYRKKDGWQVHEVLAGPLPSPEGVMQAQAAPAIAPEVAEVAPKPKEAAKKVTPKPAAKESDAPATDGQ